MAGQEHLGVALALNVPIAVCVTKVGRNLLRVHGIDRKMIWTDRHDSTQYPRTDRQYARKGLEEPWLPVCIPGHCSPYDEADSVRRIPVFVDTPQQAVDCARFLGHPVGPSNAR